MTSLHRVSNKPAVSSQVGQSRRPRVLIITANFPPVGGVGVLRGLKTAKYLPEFGYDVEVITAVALEHKKKDHALLQEIPEVPIHRVRGWFPHSWLLRAQSRQETATSGMATEGNPLDWVGSAFRRAARYLGRLLLHYTAFPDTYFFWAVAARKSVIRIIRDQEIDVIWSTHPPPSSHLLAYWASKATGLPWIADYRDPWTWRHLQTHARWFQSASAMLERRVLKNASAVVTVTEGWAKEFENRYGDILGNVLVIYNGFDPADTPVQGDAREPIEDGRCTFVWAGTFLHSRSPRALLEAVAMGFSEGLMDPRRVRLVFAGNFDPPGTDANSRLVQDLGLQDVVKKVGFIPHDEAIDLLSRADVILDIGIEGPWSHSLIPAKLVEAIGLGRPILSISVPGEASRIVESLDIGWWADQDDARSIVEALMSAMNARPSTVSNPPMVFSRRFQAGQLAELMDEVRASPDP